MFENAWVGFFFVVKFALLLYIMLKDEDVTCHILSAGIKFVVENSKSVIAFLLLQAG